MLLAFKLVVTCEVGDGGPSDNVLDRSFAFELIILR